MKKSRNRYYNKTYFHLKLKVEKNIENIKHHSLALGVQILKRKPQTDFYIIVFSWELTE